MWVSGFLNRQVVVWVLVVGMDYCGCGGGCWPVVGGLLGCEWRR